MYFGRDLTRSGGSDQNLGARDGCVLEKESLFPHDCLEIWFGDGQRPARGLRMPRVCRQSREVARVGDLL